MTNKELLEFNKNRKIAQVCYVTRDYKKTLQYMVDVLKIGPWQVLKLNNDTVLKPMLDGKEVTEPFEYICAITQVGDMEIEVIQPVHGPNVYDRFLDVKGAGMHHFKEKLTVDQIMAFAEETGKQGTPLISSGGFDEDRFYYLDTYDELGAMYELGNCATAGGLSEDDFEWFPKEK